MTYRHTKLAKELIKEKETEVTWLKIHNIFEDMLKDFSSAETIEEEFPNFNNLLLRSIQSERSRLNGVSLELLKSISQVMENKNPLNAYIPVLIKLTGRANKLFVTRAQDALMIIAKYIDGKYIIKNINENIDNVNKNIRYTVYQLVILRCSSVGSLFCDYIEKGTKDPAQEVRTLCKSIGSRALPPPKTEELNILKKIPIKSFTPRKNIKLDDRQEEKIRILEKEVTKITENTFKKDTSRTSFYEKLLQLKKEKSEKVEKNKDELTPTRLDKYLDRYRTKEEKQAPRPSSSMDDIRTILDNYKKLTGQSLVNNSECNSKANIADGNFKMNNTKPFNDKIGSFKFKKEKFDENTETSGAIISFSNFTNVLSASAYESDLVNTNQDSVTNVLNTNQDSVTNVLHNNQDSVVIENLEKNLKNINDFTEEIHRYNISTNNSQNCSEFKQPEVSIVNKLTNYNFKPTDMSFIQIKPSDQSNLNNLNHVALDDINNNNNDIKDDDDINNNKNDKNDDDINNKEKYHNDTVVSEESCNDLVGKMKSIQNESIQLHGKEQINVALEKSNYHENITLNSSMVLEVFRGNGLNFPNISGFVDDSVSSAQTDLIQNQLPANPTGVYLSFTGETLLFRNEMNSSNSRDPSILHEHVATNIVNEQICSDQYCDANLDYNKANKEKEDTVFNELEHVAHGAISNTENISGEDYLSECSLIFDDAAECDETIKHDILNLSRSFANLSIEPSLIENTLVSSAPENIKETDIIDKSYSDQHQRTGEHLSEMILLNNSGNTHNTAENALENMYTGNSYKEDLFNPRNNKKLNESIIEKFTDKKTSINFLLKDLVIDDDVILLEKPVVKHNDFENTEIPEPSLAHCQDAIENDSKIEIACIKKDESNDVPIPSREHRYTYVTDFSILETYVYSDAIDGMCLQTVRSPDSDCTMILDGPKYTEDNANGLLTKYIPCTDGENRLDDNTELIDSYANNKPESNIINKEMCEVLNGQSSDLGLNDDKTGKIIISNVIDFDKQNFEMFQNVENNADNLKQRLNEESLKVSTDNEDLFGVEKTKTAVNTCKPHRIFNDSLFINNNIVEPESSEISLRPVFDIIDKIKEGQNADLGINTPFEIENDVNHPSVGDDTIISFSDAM